MFKHILSFTLGAYVGTYYNLKPYFRFVQNEIKNLKDKIEKGILTYFSVRLIEFENHFLSCITLFFVLCPKKWK